VVPAAHWNGPLKGPLERVPPRSRVHGPLERAPPRSRVRLRLARDSLTRTPVPARGYGHLMLWHGRAAPSCAWESCPSLSHQLLRGNPSPPLWGTVRHGRCQPRDTAPPTPVRLTRRALEGGPATPSNNFLVNLQGQVMTLGRRDAIPATVGPVRPPPCSQHHAGHCYNHSGAVRHGTPPRLPVYPVWIVVNSLLKPV
jgi:hypothetical protein